MITHTLQGLKIWPLEFMNTIFSAPRAVSTSSLVNYFPKYFLKLGIFVSISFSKSKKIIITTLLEPVDTRRVCNMNVIFSWCIL